MLSSHKQTNMRFHVLCAAIFLPLLTTSVSARFFPNAPSMPPSSPPNATTSGWDAFKKFAGCHAGDKADGLAKLKEYFHYFGYIHNSNYTDDFDDAFEQALKTYQLNFNLNTTGQLDEATLNQIVSPRCGNADIENGSSSMNSGKSTPSTSGHFHTVGHYSFFDGKPVWPESKRNLTYGFLPDNQLSDTVKAVFTSAFERWAAVTPLTFTESDSYYSADLRIAFYTGDHGDGEPFDGVLGTLAHAFSPTNGRFHLDGEENWVATGDVTTSSISSAIDLESVAVHEIGHLLGLGHSSVEEAIMYPTITSRTKKVELASDDIQGIQELYGSNPNYNGSSTSPSQESETTNNSGAYTAAPRWSFGILLAVGFGLLML
ncbi:hypothetical protein AAG906_035120 [Vitis piasezkii]